MLDLQLMIVICCDLYKLDTIRFYIVLVWNKYPVCTYDFTLYMYKYNC